MRMIRSHVPLHHLPLLEIHILAVLLSAILATREPTKAKHTSHENRSIQSFPFPDFICEPLEKEARATALPDQRRILVRVLPCQSAGCGNPASRHRCRAYARSVVDS